ncbi:Dph6-related ATP pyrophosphatase [Halarchaeum acidiphilum]|uniref:Dph6-related ATP pyrophosphatase n=1 Tax=Halarchaeum acidiphilum TaxID=489138 RepID=UPI0003699785|nr:hypothetical protein [Halarchaeum acidiphilum]
MAVARQTHVGRRGVESGGFFGRPHEVSAVSQTVLAWSGGKDAACCLDVLRVDPDTEVVGLLTTVNADADRTSMHGVQTALLHRQADTLGLPVTTVDLPGDVGADAYGERMRDALADWAARGADAVAFADLYLEDVRAYRESNLADAPLSGRWPVWGRDTDAFARDVIDAGIEAVVCAVSGDALDASFVGRTYDRDFLAALPDGVDPCGEHGEFHTFVVDGPGFDARIDVDRGERVTRDLGGTPYHYVDLLLD